MKQNITIDTWEEGFFEICQKYLQEEPLYPYEHLWKKGLTRIESFCAYLKENEDYLEQFYELSELNSSITNDNEFQSIIKKLKNANNDNNQKKSEPKLSKFCPECGREIGKSGICKCGYKQKKTQSETISEEDMAAQWLAENDFDDDSLNY